MARKNEGLMRITGQRVLSALFVVSTLTLVGGCSHDTIDSGAYSLAVRFDPSPSGAGRFERAELNIATIQVLPADPDLASVYGGRALSLRFDPFTANLTLTQPVTFSQVALSAGTYKVTSITLTSPILVDTDVNPAPATCMDGVAAFPSGPAAFQVPPQTTFSSPPSLMFTVQPGQSKLSLTIDVPGLIANYEAAFTCSTTDPRCGGQACLVSFDQTAYASALLANISIE
jgi:hypothetical protein